MTTGRRLLDFGFVCLTAAAVWLVAQSLWPYLELVAPVGAIVVLLLAFNLIDGVWFEIRHRSRLAFRVPTPQSQRVTDRRLAGPSQSPAVGLSGRP